MTLKYLVIVERYLFLNGVVGNLISNVRSFVYLMEEKLVR